MITDDDIESMWGMIRPIRLPPAEPVAEPEKPPLPQHPFSSVSVLLSAAGHHGTICRSGFTTLEGDFGFRCACGVIFRIGIANARRAKSPLQEYLNTHVHREETARKLTYDPRRSYLSWRD